jgi:hypothetical protein
LAGEGDANAGMNQVPMIPGTAAKGPTAQELLPWALKMGQTGGKFGQDIAQDVVKPAIANMLPKAGAAKSPYKVAGGSVFNTDTGKWEEGSPEVRAKMEETRVNNMANLQQKADAAKQRSEDARLSIEQRREAAAEGAALRRELAAGRKEAGNDAKVTYQGVDSDGEAISYNKSTRKLERPDGSPPMSAPTTNATAAKAIASVRDVDLQISQADELEKVVKANPGAFGGLKSVGATGAAKFGDTARSAYETKAYTPAELEARATVGKQSAVLLHQLYGSALTFGEQARAVKFMPAAEDTPEQTLTKIAAAKAYLKEKRNSLPEVGKAFARPNGNAADIRSAADAILKGTP